MAELPALNKSRSEEADLKQIQADRPPQPWTAQSVFNAPIRSGFLQQNISHCHGDHGCTDHSELSQLGCR